MLCDIKRCCVHYNTGLAGAENVLVLDVNQVLFQGILQRKENEIFVFSSCILL